MVVHGYHFSRAQIALYIFAFITGVHIVGYYFKGIDIINTLSNIWITIALYFLVWCMFFYPHMKGHPRRAAILAIIGIIVIYFAANALWS
jgi:hypothetical protein